jgi:hypothetical protein
MRRELRRPRPRWTLSWAGSGPTILVLQPT